MSTNGGYMSDPKSSELRHGILTKAGLERAKVKGSRLGRPTKLEDGSARAILDLSAEGKTVREIADITGISKSLVHKTLSDPQHYEIFTQTITFKDGKRHSKIQVYNESDRNRFQD